MNDPGVSVAEQRRRLDVSGRRWIAEVKERSRKRERRRRRWAIALAVAVCLVWLAIVLPIMGANE